MKRKLLIVWNIGDGFVACISLLASILTPVHVSCKLKGNMGRMTHSICKIYVKKKSHSYLHFPMSWSFMTILKIKFRIHFSSILSLVHINLKCSIICTARVVRHCDSLHYWKSIRVTWRTSMERKLCLIDKNDIEMSIILIVCKNRDVLCINIRPW